MAKKTTKKSNTKVSASTKRFAKKNMVPLIIIILVFIAFVVAGYFTSASLTKNDGFTLKNSNKDLALEVGGVYTEEGATIISFGKDVSEYLDIEIRDEDGNIVEAIDTSFDTEYAIIYSIAIPEDAGFIDKLILGKYEDYMQVRIITVGEGANE